MEANNLEGIRKIKLCMDAIIAAIFDDQTPKEVRDPARLTPAEEEWSNAIVNIVSARDWIKRAIVSFQSDK